MAVYPVWDCFALLCALRLFCGPWPCVGQCCWVAKSIVDGCCFGVHHTSTICPHDVTLHSTGTLCCRTSSLYVPCLCVPCLFCVYCVFVVGLSFLLFFSRSSVLFVGTLNLFHFRFSLFRFAYLFSINLFFLGVHFFFRSSCFRCLFARFARFRA